MEPSSQPGFRDTVSALVEGLLASCATAPELQPPFDDVTQFICEQQAQLPDYLRTPMKTATSLFDILGWPAGARFRRQSLDRRERQIAAWKNSSIGFKRDLMRYFEGLATYGLYSPLEAKGAPDEGQKGEMGQMGRMDNVIQRPADALRADIVVIGSGPGGAITACLLAEAGREVLLIEEGPFLPLDSCTPFSREELRQKYRNGGQTFAFGPNKISYAEGRCVGGGSEINSGLYHRTPPEILEQWQKQFRVENLSEKEMAPHFRGLRTGFVRRNASGKSARRRAQAA